MGLVILDGVGLKCLFPGEGLVALVAGEGGARHTGLQSEVEFDADQDNENISENINTKCNL